MSRGSSFSSFFFVGFITVASFLGCGGDPLADLGTPLKVSGSVTMDGKPAANVEVMFARVDNKAPGEVRNIAGKTDAAGKYTLETVYPADYKVMMKDLVEKDPENFSAVDVGPYVKYGMESPLKATVAEGNVEHNFELTSK